MTPSHSEPRFYVIRLPFANALTLSGGEFSANCLQALLNLLFELDRNVTDYDAAIIGNLALSLDYDAFFNAFDTIK